jgi:hypothetical protein
MAFIKTNVNIGRGRTNNSSTPNGIAIHTYYSDTDSASIIFTSGYFDDYLGNNSEDVIVNDILWVRDSSGDYETYQITSASPLTVASIEFAETFQNLTVSGKLTFPSTAQGIDLPTFGGTPATLNYYDKGTFNATWTGAFTNPEVDIIKFSRLGDRVTLEIPGASAGQNSADTVTVPAGTVPPALRPLSANQVMPCIDLVDNLTPVIGVLKVNTDGSMEISKLDSGVFAGAGNLDWKNFPATYIL